MCLAKFKAKLILLISAYSLCLTVASLPLRAEDSLPAQKTTATEQTEPSPAGKESTGTETIARYYAKRFKGRRTSSGAIYDPKKLTAAHPTLPLGIQVIVMNPANNKSVTVTVNDRCRRHGPSFIDLSREAARQLGFLGRGKAKVRIIPIEKDDLSTEKTSEIN